MNENDSGSVGYTGRLAANDGYIFALSDQVERTSVRFTNRYGIEIAADLYRAKDFDETVSHQALVVGPPYGGVKEQGPGVYGNELAQRGFVVLAIDPSFNGESGGQPRHVSSPDIFAEDFSAGVDYLGSLPYVDREKIGGIGIGICGSGGFLLAAAQVDPRLRAVATTAMYDISRVARHGWMDSQDTAGRAAQLSDMAKQRWADVDAGEPALTPVFPDTMPAAGPDPVTREFWEFYVEERGHHPRSVGGFTVTSAPSHINFGELRWLSDIAPRPVLLVTGENAHSRYFTETVHEQLTGPKELLVVPDARHIDLYDRTDVIPFDKLEAFFSEALV